MDVRMAGQVLLQRSMDASKIYSLSLNFLDASFLCEGLSIRPSVHNAYFLNAQKLVFSTLIAQGMAEEKGRGGWYASDIGRDQTG